MFTCLREEDGRGGRRGGMEFLRGIRGKGWGSLRRFSVGSFVSGILRSHFGSSGVVVVVMLLCHAGPVIKAVERKRRWYGHVAEADLLASLYGTYLESCDGPQAQVE